MEPGDWAPLISKSLNAKTYINPIGGRDLFDPFVFKSQNTRLQFAVFDEFNYATPGYEFISGLSVLDALMWNSAEVIRKAIFENSKLVDCNVSFDSLG